MTEADSKGEIKEGPFPQYPEGSDFPGVRKILEVRGKLSHKSKIKIPTKDAGFEMASLRPDSIRKARRVLFNNTQKATREEKIRLISEGHARDILAEEFISNQQEVRVVMGDLGEQMSRFIVLTPPESRRTEDTDTKPPIFLISGISNDLESMGSLPQEIAFSGRKVVTIAYPESWHGDVTDEFGKKAEESQSYEPHISFFKGAIENIRNQPELTAKLGNFDEFELWGWSAGALMTAEILKDPKFQNLVSNAVIVAPASSVDQKNIQLPFKQEIPVPGPIIKDQLQTFRHLEDVANLSVTERGSVEYTADKRYRMARVYNALRKKVLRRYEWWKGDMKVREGGKIVVISYKQDVLAQTRKVLEDVRQNTSFSVIELPGSHHGLKLKPGEFIEAVNNAIN
jgi:hypothetical protein